MIQDIKLGDKKIGENRTYVIAEISGSHNGSLIKMKKLIKAASNSGADAVKVQKFNTDNLVVKKYEHYETLKNLEFDESVWPEIISYAKEVNIPILADVFDFNNIQFLNNLGVDGFKIHTTDIENLELINQVSSINKPIFLSIGASNLTEIDRAVTIVLNYHDKLVLMYGFQNYPTPVEDTNLSFIPILKENFNLNVGYSDHTLGGSIESFSVPLVSIAIGASVIEKHITLDRKFKDPDFQSALNPDEFKQLVNILRKLESGLENQFFELNEKEISYANAVKRRIVAKKSILAGEKIKRSDLDFKRASEGLFLDSLDLIIGRRSRVNLDLEDPITNEVLK